MHVHIRRELLVAIVLLSCFVGLFSTSIEIAHAITPRSLFQNQTIYLKSTSTDLQGYYGVSTIPPTSSTNHTIRISPKSVGLYVIGVWITPANLLFPNPITVDLDYNFQFLMYGNSTRTANASFYCSLGIYRNGGESNIFNASTSDKLTENVTGFGWQYALKSSFTFQSTDRLLFRLYLSVSKIGIFDFYYDSASCRSSFVDPPVTRYFRGTSQLQANNFYATAYTVNVGTYKSGTLANLYARDTTNTLNVSSSVSGSYNVTSIVFTGNFSDASATYSNNLPFISVEYALFVNGTGTKTTKVQFYNYTKTGYQTSGEMYDSFSTPTTSTLRYRYSTFNCTQFRGGSSPTWEWTLNVTTYYTLAFHFAMDYLKVIPRWFNFSTQSSTTESMGDWIASASGILYGIRVSKVNSDRTETAISSGTVAEVFGGDATEYRSATWTPTKTSGLTALAVRIYTSTNSLDYVSDVASGGTPLVFYTEDLGSSNVLEANTWTVYYHFTYYPILDITLFTWGQTTNRNVRAENVLIDAGTAWQLISTWTMNLQTRQWNLVSTWREDLSARKWNLIATWTENLVARSWNLISTWRADLLTRQWNQIGIWMFDLRPPAWTLISTWTTYLVTRQWTPISTWSFDLHARGWTLISIWTFDLGGQNYAFLIIPILFLCACVLLAFYLSKK